MNLKLKDFQLAIAKKIDQRKKNRKRVSGVKLATGGGKSFIYMDQLVKCIDENNALKAEELDCISDVASYYFTPTDVIIEQTEFNILNYIVIENYIKKFLNNDPQEAIQEIAKRIASCYSTSDKNEYKQIVQEFDTLYKNYSGKTNESETCIREIFESFLMNFNGEYSSILKKELPNVHIATYKSLEKMDISQFVKNVKLIAFDEAHKSGAKEWRKKIIEMIKKFKKTNFLFITATPERDADGSDPIEYYAVLADEDNLNELRNKEYLASDTTLMDSIENDLVVAPIVVSMDYLLDETDEYKMMLENLNIYKEKYEDAQKNFIARVRKNNNAKMTPKEIRCYGDYNKLLKKFLEISVIVGKAEYFKERIAEGKKLGNSDAIIRKWIEEPKPLFTFPVDFEALIGAIIEIEQTEEYKKWKEEKVQTTIDKVKNERDYINHGKHICFSPVTKAGQKPLEILGKYKQKMLDFFHLPQENVMLTHSDKDVVSKEEDRTNLAKFRLIRGVLKNPLIMVAMDKFNEGMHVGGIVALEMFRTFKSSKAAEDKEEPRITFLQQIGRAIRTKKDGEIITEPPVIFDFACNFMRFRDKLKTKDGKDLFQISEKQIKFKELYDSFENIIQNSKEADKKKSGKKFLERILFMMEVLSNNGVDISSVEQDTRLGELLLGCSNDEKNKILDEIYGETAFRVTDDYKMGLYIISARNAFWHETGVNSQTSGNVLYYNKATDKIFEKFSFKYLYDIGLFKDLEKNKTLKSDKSLKIDDKGFLIGECANFSQNKDLNVFTGTEFSLDRIEEGRLGVKKNGFSELYLNADTDLIYDIRFFYYNSDKNKWLNLLTDTESDLLGYNVDGLRVSDLELDENGEMKKCKDGESYALDRNGLWHKRLSDGSFSKDCCEYNGDGLDAYGFKKGDENKISINNWFKRRDKYGRPVYEFGPSRQPTDFDGYTIQGYDIRGYNRAGIHRDTSMEYDLTAHKKPFGSRADAEIFLLDKAIKEKDEIALIKLMIILKRNPEILKSNLGSLWGNSEDIRVRISPLCTTVFKETETLELQEKMMVLERVREKTVKEKEKKSKLAEKKKRLLKLLEPIKQKDEEIEL